MRPWLGLLNVYATRILCKKIMQLKGLNIMSLLAYKIFNTSDGYMLVHTRIIHTD